MWSKCKSLTHKNTDDPFTEFTSFLQTHIFYNIQAMSGRCKTHTQMHRGQTNNTILSDKTQGKSNHCLSSGSVQSKMFSLFIFPLPGAPSKAPQREKGNKERRESSLLNPCRAERWGEAGGETHEEGWGEVESGTDREGGEKNTGVWQEVW